MRPTITELRESGAFCVSENADNRHFSKKERSGEMTVAELKRRIDAGTAPFVLDVREAVEAKICRLPGSVLIPLGELSRRLDELDRSAEIVVHCKSGARSARAVSLLRGQGFGRAANLSGGILKWINEIDPSMSRY
jgi:adenylyltransferase/sulfurtransferase